MPAQVVPKIQFPMGMTEVTARLASTYVNAYGVLPSKNLLMVTAGIVGVENAGGVYIWNGNVGNTTAPANYEGRIWQANGLDFLDFVTVEEGMTYWWAFMARRYLPVLLDADQGDADAAVRDLFRLGYVGRVTTSVQESNYRRGVWAYMRKVNRDAEVIVNQTRRDYMGIAVGAGSLFALGALGFIEGRARA
jgi:hypothetical protein